MPEINNDIKGDDKYLVFDTKHCRPAGLDHKLSTLKSAIKEAILLDRVLVLRSFAICPYQNFIYKHNSTDKLTDSIINNIQLHQDAEREANYIKFEHYINLAKTKTYELEDNGELREIEKSLRYMDEENFDLGAYVDEPQLLKPNELIDEYPNAEAKPINDQVLVMDNNEPLGVEQNNQYKVVVRRTNKYVYNVGADSLLVNFHPSDKVEWLTDAVLKSLGTSLNSAKKRFAFYNGAAISEMQDNYQTEFSKKYPLYYACLHVRANDVFRYTSIRYGTDPHNLKHIVKRAVPQGSIIYIMSDISNPGYFDFLKKDYKVYQYFDFAELRSLVSNENKDAIDNAMLYSVEKNILQYAHIKLVRARANPKLIYTNSSHEIPWRCRLSSIYDYLTTDILRQRIGYSWQEMIKPIKSALKSNPQRL